MNREINYRHIALCIVAFGLLFGVLMMLSFPGTMTNDTIGWIFQARSGKFGGLQPVGAPLFFTLTDDYWPGPMSLVSFNLLLISASLLCALFKTYESVIVSFIGAIFILFYPSVLTLLPIAWRDITGLGVTLLSLLIAILINQKAHRSTLTKPVLFFILIVLCYFGALLRTNHAAGVWPIVTFSVIALLLKSKYHPFKRFIASVFISGFLLALMTLSAMSTSRHIKAQNSITPQAVMTYHLALLSDRVGEDLFPKSIYPDLDLAKIRALLQRNLPYRVFWKAFSRGNNSMLPRLSSDEDQQLLRDYYWQGVMTYKLEFMAIRLSEILGWFDPENRDFHRPYAKHKIPAASFLIELNFETEKPGWSSKFIKNYSNWNGNLLNKTPIPLMSIAIVAAFLSYRLKLNNRNLIAVTSMVSIMHFLGVAIVVAMFPYRYGHQSNLFSLFAITLFAIDVITRLLKWKGRDDIEGIVKPLKGRLQMKQSITQRL